MIHLGELLSAYLDGETTADETKRVVAHLASCDRCSDEMSDIHAARGALRSLPVLDMPADVFERLGVSPTVVPIRKRPLTWVAAAAAAILIFVATATLTAPDAIGVTLNDLSFYHEQQQQIDPGIAPSMGLLGAAQ